MRILAFRSTAGKREQEQLMSLTTPLPMREHRVYLALRANGASPGFGSQERFTGGWDMIGTCNSTHSA